MRRRRINSRSGETIVEVMVSVLIFLMLMAVLQGAIMFCNSAQKKSQQIRQDTAEICEKLQSATAEGNGSANLNLYNYLSNFPHFIGFPACPLVK